MYVFVTQQRVALHVCNIQVGAIPEQRMAGYPSIMVIEVAFDGARSKTWKEDSRSALAEACCVGARGGRVVHSLTAATGSSINEC